MTGIAKKLTFEIIVIGLLTLGLLVTSASLMLSIATTEDNPLLTKAIDNVFGTGFVDIELNKGESVISEQELLFAPGMTVEKDFTIDNVGSCDVYYKIYFVNTKGTLADVLEIEIKDGDEVLFSGTPASMTREGTAATDVALRMGESKTLKIVFSFPEDADNSAQSGYLAFDLAADATQAKNNDAKEFN